MKTAAPQQDRSVRSLNRMLDAAEQLMERHHFEDIAVADVAALAGTSVGNFYGRFASKNDLLDALHQRYEQQRAKIWRDFLRSPQRADDSLAETISGLIKTAIKNYRAHRGVLRTLVTRQWRNPEQMTDQERRDLGGLYEEGFSVLLRHRGEIRHPDPDSAVRIGAAVVLAACRENIVLRPVSMPASLKVGEARLSNELSAMLYAYLTCSRSKVSA